MNPETLNVAVGVWWTRLTHKNNYVGQPMLYSSFAYSRSSRLPLCWGCLGCYVHRCAISAWSRPSHAGTASYGDVRSRHLSGVVANTFNLDLGHICALAFAIAINVSLQHNGGFLPDILQFTLSYSHRGTRLNLMRSCDIFSP